MTTSEIFIDATEIDPRAQARAVVGHIQEDLLNTLRATIALVIQPNLDDDARAAARALLTDVA
jgi:hypothetical protein